MELKQYQEAYEKLKAGRKDEPSWLLRLREEAIVSFTKKGFPTLKDDAWRYTDLAPIRDTAFALENKPIQPRGLDPSREGVEILDISEAISVFPELLEKYLGQHADPEKNPFTALNAALFQSGSFIRIDAGVVLKEPIRIVHSAASGACQRRMLILVGKGSTAVVLETYDAGDPPQSIGGSNSRGDLRSARSRGHLTNAVTEIVLEEDARMEHCKIQNEGPGAFHVALTQVTQKRGSSFVSFALSTGGRLMRNDCRVALAAEGASCELNGLYLGDKDQVLDHQTFVDHQKPDGKSDQFFKGIMAGNSRGVFRGHVMVRQDAQRTDAHQTNKNLLLSDTARVDAQPQLEILADDVKCSHGAAIGQLQEDALFYLRSRGIGEQDAGRMLAQGFAREVIDRSSLSFMKETLLDLVNEKLTQQLRNGKE
jgi:Fe-S cluster assembly protein SufD